MMAPATKAAVKPSTSADGVAVPAASASVVRDVAIVESAAIPSAPPICCEVLPIENDFWRFYLLRP